MMKIVRTLKQIRSMRLTYSRWLAIKQILMGRPTIFGAKVILANEKSLPGITIQNMSVMDCFFTPGDKPGVYGA